MKKLQLNKIKISKLNNLNAIKGGNNIDTLQNVNDTKYISVDCTLSSDCQGETNTNTILGEATVFGPPRTSY